MLSSPTRSCSPVPSLPPPLKHQSTLLRFIAVPFSEKCRAKLRHRRKPLKMAGLCLKLLSNCRQLQVICLSKVLSFIYSIWGWKSPFPLITIVTGRLRLRWRNKRKVSKDVFFVERNFTIFYDLLNLYYSCHNIRNFLILLNITIFDGLIPGPLVSYWFLTNETKLVGAANVVPQDAFFLIHDDFNAVFNFAFDQHVIRFFVFKVFKRYQIVTSGVPSVQIGLINVVSRSPEMHFVEC